VTRDGAANGSPTQRRENKSQTAQAGLSGREPAGFNGIIRAVRDSASLRGDFLLGMAVIYLLFALRRAAQYFFILSETAFRSAALILFRPRRFPVGAAESEPSPAAIFLGFRPRPWGKVLLNI
jgi:hypothetical protein